MQIVVTIFSALLPALFLIGYIYFRDKNKREPMKEILRAVWYGVLSIAPALMLATPASFLGQFIPTIAESGILSSLCSAFTEAAIPEEIAKFIMLFYVLRNNSYFDERMDGIVYAVAVSMGFAGVENVLYLLNNMDDLLGVGLARALFAVPGHFFYAVFMGYFFSLAHFDGGRKKYLNYALALIVPILLHGVYDALLFVMEHLPVALILISLVLFIAFNIFINVMAHKRIRKMFEADLKDERMEDEGAEVKG